MLTRVTADWTAGSFIHFRNLRKSDSGKTNIYGVVTLDNQPLGEIRWFARWRKYAFYPHAHTVFESTCLGEIAEFCTQETKAHSQRV